MLSETMKQKSDALLRNRRRSPWKYIYIFFILIFLLLLNFRVTLKTSCECCITLHLTLILVERLFAEAAELYLLKALSAC